jgi:hypothetical protein
MTAPKIIAVAAMHIVANPVDLASLAGGAITAAHERGWLIQHNGALTLLLLLVFALLFLGKGLRGLFS